MWNRIEESASEEETLGSSYFTNGLFKISNEEQSTKDPRVLSLLQKKRLFIAVDCSLILLEDCTSVDCRFISFGSEINCFAVSHNGDYVVCCLNDGNIHGIHVKALPLFNVVIQEEDISNTREQTTFVDIQMDLSGKCTIICSNGSIYEMSGLEESEIEANISAEFSDSTCIMNQTALLSPSLDRISSLKIPSKIKCFACVPSYWGNSYVVCCLDYVAIVNGGILTRIKYPEGASAIKKILNLDNFILGLTENGMLLEICVVTGIVRVLHLPTEFSIDDMRAVESNEEFIELMILSKPTDSERLMKVVDFPSLKCKSDLNLPVKSWIVSQSKSAVTMYFIEGYTNEKNFVQTLEIKSITDTDPEQRFHKLLHRGQFDDAEAFAKTCGLSLEPLHRMRVRKSLIELASLRSDELLEQKFAILMQQLLNVEDKNFLVSLRSSPIPNRNCLTKFLEYILQNINTNDFPKETNEINELLLRLETLRLIDPENTNMRWQRFLEEKDMQKAAVEYFKTDVVLSCLVWSRHASTIIPTMNLQNFYAWLIRIPTTLEPFKLIQWLKHFAPCFLQTYPNETTRIIDWCLERTRALQFSPTWPEIGLEFSNNIQSIFSDMKFMFVDVRRSYHCNMEKILKLIHTLEEMVVLKKTYHLIISLDDYCRNSIEETAFKLLQRIQIHNLAKMVNEFLYPIFMENGLNPEETILRYIQFLSNNKNLGYWQERAVTSIGLLNNEENRLNSALLILKVSPVPWSDVVMPLAKLGTTSNHPIAHSILIEFKSQSIKIIKIKYGWPVDYFDFQQDRMQLVFRILKLNLPEMIKDIKTLIESSPDIASDAYIQLIHRLVELGKIEEFSELLAEIESDQEKIILRAITVFIEYFDSDLVEENQEEYFMEAFKILLGRLKETVDDFKLKYNAKQVQMIKNVVTMRKSFDLKLRLKDLQKNSKSGKLNETIEILTTSIQNEKSLEGIWGKVNLLSRTFEMNVLHIFHLICHKLSNVFITCHLVENICSTLDTISDKIEIESALALAVLMLSQQIAMLENNLFNLTAQPYDPLAFPLAFELLTKCKNVDSSRPDSVFELITWIELVRRFYPFNAIELTANERKISEKIFTKNAKISNGHSMIGRRDSLSIFDNLDDGHAAPIAVTQLSQKDETLKPVLECVCNALKLVIFVLKVEKNPYKLFSMYLENDESQQIRDKFSSALENVLKQKLNMIAFGVIQLIFSHQKTTKINVLPPVFISTVHKKILKYMLSQKEPDYVNAFIILRAEGNQMECLDYLKQQLRNNSQRIAFSTFSEMYNKYKNSDECVVDREARLKLFYYTELCKQYPNLRAPNNLNSIGISEFLMDLEKRQLSVDLLKKLCKDFGWNYQKMLIQQIKIILDSQQLEFEIKTDQFGKDEVAVKSSVEGIKKLCASYLTEITDLTLLGSELEKFFVDDNVNVYFYELYLAVIDLIEHAKDLSYYYRSYRTILLLLKFNLTLKRRAIESDEYEYWIQNHAGDSGVLPVISNYRLPFKLIIKSLPENIIGKDLNVENFELYYPLIKVHAELLHTTPDINDRVEVCSIYAAKNSVQDLQNQADSTGTSWNLQPRNNAFLQAVLRMMTFLTDKSKILATLYFITNNIPRGCDQVEAAHECWKYAIAHEKALRDQPKFFELVNKIKQKYPTLKTQHLLHLYGVYDDKLMQLIDKPDSLIHKLYCHESVLGSQKKEINKLSSELAELHGIDLLSLQIKFLQHWLAFADVTSNSIDENGADINETVYEDFMGNTAATANATNEESNVSDENVVRAYYILSSWNNEAAMDFLASEFSSNVTNPENHMQLYECFAKLVNEKSESYLEIVSPENYLVIRVCHYLKMLGINLRTENFENCDKVELLKKIWTNHYNNPKGLEVMALICLTYDVHMPQIWNGILKQMVTLKMIKHLSILVEILSTKTKLLHLSNLKLAWEFVMQEPLIHASKTQSYEQDLQISKTFVLLQKCPISTFLNLTGFAEKCIRLERPHMAAIFIGYAKEGERQKIIEMLTSCDKRELKKNIVELEEFGVAQVITRSVINILGL